MLIQGEKYACDACVRGHRVSSCQHSDRPLTHINKKGRPVSQCPHCRGLRKARTTHVKCDCGGKTHGPVDCAMAERTKDNQSEPDGNSPLDSVATSKPVGPRKQCCCSHSARCICAGKKDSTLPPVPEAGLPQSLPPTGFQRPRPTSAVSEGILTGFPFRHHKIKHGDLRRGQPYSIPTSGTVHGSSALARRSADHLPLSNEFAEQDVTPYQDSTVHRPPPLRRAKSENGSPENPPTFTLGEADAMISPIDISVTPFSVTGLPLADSDSPWQDQDSYYSSSAIDSLLDSETLNEPSGDWPTFGSFTTAYSQPTSYTGFGYNNLNHPGLTRSSSGDVSEVEEFGPHHFLNLSKSDSYDMHSVSDASEVDAYHLGAPPSYMGLPETRILFPDNLESINPGTFLKPAGTASMASPQLQLAVGLDGPYPMTQNLLVQTEPVFAAIETNISPQSSGPPVTPASNEPMWTSTPFGYTTSPVSTGGSPLSQFHPRSRECVL